MKNKLLLLTAVLLFLSSLTACDKNTENTNIPSAPQDEHEHTYEYVQFEAAHFKQYTCGCPSPEIAEMHFDDNNDGKCDACEYTLSTEKHTEHTMIWYKDEYAHSYKYTCGCLTPPNTSMHCDGDGDDVCDVCGYSLLPEGNYFLRNQAGCEWLNEIDVENISKIEIISQGIGIAPGNLKRISRTDNKNVISDMLEKYYWLDTKPILRQQGLICGGSSKIVTFTLNDGTEKVIRINNGNYRDTNGNYFDLYYIPTFDDYTEYTSCYGFISYRGTGEVLSGGSSLCEIPMSELEFIETDAPATATEAYCYIETDFGNLVFVENSVFYIEHEEDVYYRLAGMNLDELIAKYTEPA